jgi:hypothetical protein
MKEVICLHYECVEDLGSIVLERYNQGSTDCKMVIMLERITDETGLHFYRVEIENIDDLIRIMVFAKFHFQYVHC